MNGDANGIIDEVLLLYSLILCLSSGQIGIKIIGVLLMVALVTKKLT